MTPAEARVVTAMRAAGLEVPAHGAPLKDTLNAIADGIEHLHAELGKARAQAAEVGRLPGLLQAQAEFVAAQRDRIALLEEVARAGVRVLQRWERIKAAGGQPYELDRRPEGALSLREALTNAGFLEEAKADG